MGDASGSLPVFDPHIVHEMVFCYDCQATV